MRYPQLKLKKKARRSGPVDDRALLTEAEPSSPAYELRPDAPDVPDGSASWTPFTDVWSPDAIRMCWIFVCAAFGSVRRSTPCS